MRLVDRAEALESLGLSAALAADTEQPLFPAVIAATHRGAIALIGAAPSWAAIAQTTAAMCLVLCVVPL
ncbi:MAG: hypothetical protein KDA63_08800, partial [Planctomycetales bacterium]|nr:hypothetical protein [Planctomycetales bacterium]